MEAEAFHFSINEKIVRLKSFKMFTCQIWNTFDNQISKKL